MVNNFACVRSYVDKIHHPVVRSGKSLKGESQFDFKISFINSTISKPCRQVIFYPRASKFVRQMRLEMLFRSVKKNFLRVNFCGIYGQKTHFSSLAPPPFRISIFNLDILLFQPKVPTRNEFHQNRSTFLVPIFYVDLKENEDLNKNSEPLRLWGFAPSTTYVKSSPLPAKS